MLEPTNFMSFSRGIKF